MLAFCAWLDAHELLKGKDTRLATFPSFLALVKDRGSRVIAADLIFVCIGLAATLMNTLLSHDQAVGILCQELTKELW